MGEVGAGWKTIDAHHHLWSYSAEEFGWISDEMSLLRKDFLPRDLRQAMQAASVDGAVAVQARQSVVETDWLLGLAEKDEAMLGVVGFLPMQEDGFAELLGRYEGRGKLKGLRHVVQDEPDDNFILGAAFNRGVRAMQGTGLVYDILIHERHLPQAATFVGMHPEQAFVVDHLAKPRIRAGELEPWRANLRQLAAAGDVSCKLSGMVTEADWERWTLEDLRPYLDAALKAFGAERLMAGSDWPVCLLASGYERWWEALRTWAAPLREAEREAIFGGTAKRVYRLGE
jgi:L-fuconolactonase